MLERAALHQTRFRTPGVSPDARGVVLGQKGFVLFPSIDRLVAFLRAYGDEGSLDDLLPSLVLRRLVTPLKTREIMLSVNAESSYRMDRVAGVAKLAGGLVFTGTQRHFVKYRDSASPLGYDVVDLLDRPADVVLYHDTFQQAYSFDRDIELKDLVFKLQPFRVPPRERTTPERLFATAEVGVGGALISYLFRWQVPARAALAEWPSQSAFEDGAHRLYVFELTEVPQRVVHLMESLPGVHVFEPLGQAVAVELGYRHPVALDSCGSLFSDDALHLFRGDGEVQIVHPLPPFAPVRSLVRTHLDLEDEARAPEGGSVEADLTMSLPLKLAQTSEPWRAVIATVVPATRREWLARMLYALPANTLGSLRVAVGEDRYYLLDRSGIEGVPIGTFYSEVAPKIYVPSGLVLVPAVSPAVLSALVRDRGDGHVFFDPARPEPTVVADAAFGPVSRTVLRDISAAPVHADRPVDPEPPLPFLEYAESRRFPLWGIPGKDAPVGGGAEEDSE